jgi:ribonuclease HI
VVTNTSIQPANNSTVYHPCEITIHTDGGCWPNPGNGGWGAVIRMPDGTRTELYGGETGSSTNNRMELAAAIKALESLPKRSRVTLYSDSEYVVNGMNKWIDGWKQRRWTTAKKQPVRNRELWERLDDAANRHSVKFRWVRGHNGNPGNERAHALAEAGALKALGRVLNSQQLW